MISRSVRCTLFTILLTIFSASGLRAQSTGLINRPATSAAGRAILDPNGDGFTSLTSAGFSGNDVANSELPYRSVPSFSIEPYGDLRRGPDHRYSDFVPDANGIGNYAYYDGTNLLFRWRMGSVMSGSKGYSILLDTDGKFGATGSEADPNYQAETTGTNGNPGFEIEIVLETNFRIAIYNVDGTSNPILIKSYPNWQEMSQVSIAGTFDNGDPDFFIDFYIPFSDLTAGPFSISTSTPLRMGATTVMSPQAAIGGPKSDIYGMSDAAYKSTNAQYEAYIKRQPKFTAGGLGTGGFGPPCTEPPVVNSGIGVGSVAISGTWTKAALSGTASTATITVYRNGSLLGTVPNVSSGSSWSLNSVIVASGDIITAKAQGTGESMCEVSNSVVAQNCSRLNIPATTQTITCSSRRGIEGTFLTGNTVKVYWIDPATLITSAVGGPAANSPTFGYSGSNFYYNHTDYNGSQIPSACSGGSQDMPNGTYYVTTIASGSTCESAPVYACVNLTSAATPTIAQSVIYSTTKTVSGTATTGAIVQLWINGQLVLTQTATGGAFAFSGLSFTTGDVVDVRALTSGACASASATRTVACFTAVPLIAGDKNGQITAGSPISGSSDEAVGSSILIYTLSGNTLIATASVQAGGIWSTGNSGTLPSTYSAVAGVSYYAVAQNSCGTSLASGSVTAAAMTTNRCGTISSPIFPGDPTISGTLASAVAGTTVNLYLDGERIGSVTSGTSTWSISTASLTNPIYNYGVLTIGIQEAGKGEQVCPGNLTISCNTGPPTPIISPTSSTLTAGQSQTYTISNAQIGAFYGICDAATGRQLGAGVWATSSTVTLTSSAFTSGTYSVMIKGTNLSGVNVCSSPGVFGSVVVSGVLPLNLVSFTAVGRGNRNELNWQTEAEQNVDRFIIERSNDGQAFLPLAVIQARNTSERSVYTKSDDNPFPVSFYRLKIVDRDSRFVYSSIVRIASLKAGSVTVSPNPFASFINLSIANPITRQHKLSIFDATGRIVLTKELVIFAGVNSITWDGLGTLPSGYYTIQLTDSNSSIVFQQKLLHQ